MAKDRVQIRTALECVAGVPYDRKSLYPDFDDVWPAKGLPDKEYDKVRAVEVLSDAIGHEEWRG
jgi:hypothetical protein